MGLTQCAEHCSVALTFNKRWTILTVNILIYLRYICPGVNTPQDTSCTVTCLPSRKLYKLDEPDMQDTAREARTNSSVMCSYGPPHMARQEQDNQLEHAYNSFVRIRDVTLKTYQKRWTIGKSGERGSGISVLPARHDDDDDDDIYINVEIWKCTSAPLWYRIGGCNITVANRYLYLHVLEHIKSHIATSIVVLW